MKRRGLITVIIIIILIIIATAIIKVWPKQKQQEEVKIINKIEKYGYVLEDNETNLHKDYFNELVDILKTDNIDEEEYAKTISMLFVSDFYNLDNKITKNDIGGIQYIHTQVKDNMILKAKDTIYKYLESNIDNNRKQELPVVSKIEVKGIDQVEFEYGDETDEEAYEIELSWTYKKDLGYQDEATIIVIHEDNKLSIVELK